MKKVNLPFIVGVMSDLAGKSQSEEAQKVLADRKFLEIDIDNFDRRMSALKPCLEFKVENTLTGEGLMDVNIDFESMDDFSPARWPQGRRPEPARRSPQPALGPADLHGRQERRRRAAGQGAERPGPAQVHRRRAPDACRVLIALC